MEEIFMSTEALHRRQFLQKSGLLSVVPAFVRAGISPGDWREFEVVTRVEVVRPVGVTRIWVPVPFVSDSHFQKALGNRLSCEGGTTKTFEQKAESLAMVRTEFPADVRPVVTVTSRVATRNWRIDWAAGKGTHPVSGAQQFLLPTKMLPLDGIVKETAARITRNSRTDLEKARAIYEWVVENTERNPKTRGCGVGDIRFMLESGDLSGKCADINALYVGLARASGVPARDVYGLRVAKSQMGCKSLGLSSENATKAQHCRAEVYLSKYGWVPVDPADVRKVMLEETPGHRSLQDEMVTQARGRLFGSWEMNWMAYNYAQDVVLPGSSGPPVRFLMYPMAETQEGRLDSLDPDSFSYALSARELTSGL